MKTSALWTAVLALASAVVVRADDSDNSTAIIESIVQNATSGEI
jgi:hypothetical protein